MVRLTAAVGAIALISSYASAFTVTPSSTTFTRPAVQSSTARSLMTDEEIDAIFKAASDCAESECNIDEVDNLISTLKTQEDQLKTRLALIGSMIEKLSHVNEKSDREVDEVRQYVRDFLRVFTNTKGGFNPTGFSGDVGDGPTTAYDALPPKPWKASN